MPKSAFSKSVRLGNAEVIFSSKVGFHIFGRGRAQNIPRRVMFLLTLQASLFPRVAPIISTWGMRTVCLGGGVKIDGRVAISPLGGSRAGLVPWATCRQISLSGSPKPHPSKPHPWHHATSENGSCAAVFGMLRCRNCTAAFAFLQCGRHLYQKLRCSKRKTALQHRNRCVAGKWRLPAAFLRVSSPHV